MGHVEITSFCLRCWMVPRDTWCEGQQRLSLRSETGLRWSCPKTSRPSERWSPINSGCSLKNYRKLRMRGKNLWIVACHQTHPTVSAKSTDTGRKIVRSFLELFTLIEREGLPKQSGVKPIIETWKHFKLKHPVHVYPTNTQNLEQQYNGKFHQQILKESFTLLPDIS